MLPGFRFLVVATVLSAALLTFGLGAVALLRAAHRVAALPWQPPQAVLFVGRAETGTAAPTLSLLRVEPPQADPVADAAADPRSEPVTAEPADSTAGAAAEATVAPVADETAADETADAAPPAGEASATGDFPPPPEPVIRDATADVLAALPAANADTHDAAIPPSEPTPASLEPAPQAAAPETVPAPAETETRTAALSPAPAAPQAVAAEPVISETVMDAVEVVPGAIVAHPPLPRPRPQQTHAASRAAGAAKRRRATAPRRQTATPPPAPVAPQTNPFALPFGQPFQ